MPGIEHDASEVPPGIELSCKRHGDVVWEMGSTSRTLSLPDRPFSSEKMLGRSPQPVEEWFRPKMLTVTPEHAPMDIEVDCNTVGFILPKMCDPTAYRTNDQTKSHIAAGFAVVARRATEQFLHLVLKHPNANQRKVLCSKSATIR
jgi:hypothetical protein